MAGEAGGHSSDIQRPHLIDVSGITIDPATNVINIFEGIRADPRYGNPAQQEAQADNYLYDAIELYQKTGEALPPPVTARTVAADIIQGYVERFRDRTKKDKTEANDWLDRAIENVSTESDLAQMETEPDEPEPVPATTPKSTKEKLKELEAEEDAKNQELLQRFHDCRDELALISAAFSSRTVRVGHSRDALRAAKHDYKDSLRQLVSHEVQVDYERGHIELHETDKIAKEREQQLHDGLVEALQAERYVATGMYERSNNRDHKTKNFHRKYHEPGWRRSIRGRLNELYKWWGEQHYLGRRGKANKIAASTAIGLFFGGASAVVGPVVLPTLAIGSVGTIIATGLATGISRSATLFHLDKRGNSRARNQIKELNEVINNDPGSVADHLEAQALGEFKGNRRRLKIALGAMAGGIIAGELVHVIPHLVGNHSPVEHHPSPKPVPSKSPSAAVSPMRTPHVPHPPVQPRHGISSGTAPTPRGTAIAGVHMPWFTEVHKHAINHIYVSAHQIGHQAVSTFYEHAEGAHRGFLAMIHAAHQAMREHLLEKVQPDPSNPSLFWYKVTKAGAKKFAKGAAGSSKTIDVMRVLSHTGRLSILHR